MAESAAAAFTLTLGLSAAGQTGGGGADAQQRSSGQAGVPLEGVPEDMRSIVLERLQQLAADDWLQREQAEVWFEQASMPDSAIESLLNSDALLPEQRHRMLSALRDRIIGRHGGALGIRMSPADFGVQVMDVLPNMPSWGLLRRGDIIIRIDEEDVIDSSDLERILKARRPGQTITVRVLRRRENAAVPAPPDQEELQPTLVEIRLGDETGFSQQEQEERQRERFARASALVREHAPRPVLLRLPPDAELNETEHPAVAALRRQLEVYINSRDEIERRIIRSEWRLTREALQAAALEPGIPDDVRKRRVETYQKYLELLPAGIE